MKLTALHEWFIEEFESLSLTNQRSLINYYNRLIDSDKRQKNAALKAEKTKLNR